MVYLFLEYQIIFREKVSIGSLIYFKVLSVKLMHVGRVSASDIGSTGSRSCLTILFSDQKIQIVLVLRSNSRCLISKGRPDLPGTRQLEKNELTNRCCLACFH